MKKHNFEQAISIFKGMFDGWCVVTKDGRKYDLRGMHYLNEYVYSDGFLHEISDISHLEQTLPINGDEVWAWENGYEKRNKYIYIGKATTEGHICSTANGLYMLCANVELISPTRKLTISEATELLKGVVQEPFEIVKNKSE